MKLHLDRWWEKELVFKIARTKIHQNFLASKYDIKQHSGATSDTIIVMVISILLKTYILTNFNL